LKKSIKNRQIIITDYDMQRLEELIENNRAISARDTRYLDELAQELQKAEIVPPDGIPPDVITMNSRVRLKDVNSGEELVYTLVFPGEANLEKGRISVLAPVGTALIGYRKGDRISWPIPGGIKKLHVKKICYQPEASGDYHL